MPINLQTEIETEFVRTSEGNIRVLIRRTSPAYPWLILSPGQGDAAESLLKLIELAGNQGLNIAVFDPSGHGLSDEPRTDYSPKCQQVVWEAVLNKLQIKQAYIGGYSYGAYSAVWCSGALADRIKGLILIEGGYLSYEIMGKTVKSGIEGNLNWMRKYHFDSWEEALKAIQSEVNPWTDYDEAEFYASLVERDGSIVMKMTENTIIQMEQAIGEYSTNLLEGLTCPILLLHSTLPPEKKEMRERGLTLFHRHAPHARIIPIPNCGHTIKEHLPFVTDQIVEFIRGVS